MQFKRQFQIVLPEGVLSGTLEKAEGNARPDEMHLDICELSRSDTLVVVVICFFFNQVVTEFDSHSMHGTSGTNFPFRG